MKKLAILFSIIVGLTSSLSYSYAYDEDYYEQTRSYTQEEEAQIQEEVNQMLANMPQLSSKKPKVVIDPGHGGTDSGAVSSDRKFYEKNLNIDIAHSAADYLRANGIEVIMTRTKDESVSLKQRSTLSNSTSPMLYVSIHNDTGEGNGNGAHVIYSSKDKNGGPSKTLASNILNSIDANTIQNKASRGIWTRQLDDGRDYYHVIREVKAPSVIVECSYMNANDIQAVNTLAKRQSMGKAIGIGILQTIKGIKDYAGHWAESEIDSFINKGHIGGYPDGTFRPDDSITRGEFVKIFNRVFGLKNTSGIVFNDTKNHWAKYDIDIAVTNGVASGMSETEFKPDQAITREEAASMIANYKKLGDENHDKLGTYADAAQVSSWALNTVEGVIESGYMGGYSDNTFRPKNKITRAEAVATLSRIK